ncbi:MAG: hypothetical protein GX891_03705, partial [Clostridiales bacterium]|nr:hypothetical protein [Clostridiales bacterium]
IILTEGRPVPSSVIITAAEILSADGGGDEIDYTERKNVKRIKNGHPGQVTYTNYKTVSVKPNPHPEIEKKQ